MKIVASLLAGWLAIAANVATAGDAPAERRLGMKYYRGEGVRIDYARALEHLSRAVELGDAESAIRLGKMYEFGMGVPADDTQATLWYTRGAELGNVEAQFAASERYYKGLGVARDPVEAVKWWTLAMRDPAYAPTIRVGVQSAEAKVSRDDVSRGQGLARSWLARQSPVVR